MHLGIDGRYIRDSYPGIGRYTYHLLEALLDLGLGDEWSVLFDPTAEDTRFSIGRLEGRGGVTLVPTEIPARTWTEQARLPSLLADLGLDLFHAPFYLYPYLSGVPAITTVHDVIPLAFPVGFPARSRWLFRLGTQLAVWRSRRIIAVSSATAKALDGRFAGAVGKIDVVPEGVAPRFRPWEHDQVVRIRDRHGLPEQYLLAVGIDSPHKNLRLLAEVVASLRSAPPLILAGPSDPRYEGTRQAVEELDLGERVLFAGELPEEDLPGVYSGAMVFLFPSLQEGFGLPVLEAMACGTPVISSNASSLPEVVGDAGILVDPRDPAAWTEAIAALLDDPMAREPMRHKGIDRARGFTWRRAAVETRKVYDRALQTSARSLDGGIEGGNAGR